MATILINDVLGNNTKRAPSGFGAAITRNGRTDIDREWELTAGASDADSRQLAKEFFREQGWSEGDLTASFGD